MTQRPPSTPRYRARCPRCPWTGREFTRYASAEDAARDHARQKAHETHVIDHYGMRVVGSTQGP